MINCDFVNRYLSTNTKIPIASDISGSIEPIFEVHVIVTMALGMITVSTMMIAIIMICFMMVYLWFFCVSFTVILVFKPYGDNTEAGADVVHPPNRYKFHGVNSGSTRYLF